MEGGRAPREPDGGRKRRAEVGLATPCRNGVTWKKSVLVRERDSVSKQTGEGGGREGVGGQVGDG